MSRNILHKISTRKHNTGQKRQERNLLTSTSLILFWQSESEQKNTLMIHTFNQESIRRSGNLCDYVEKQKWNSQNYQLSANSLTYSKL